MDIALVVFDLAGTTIADDDGVARCLSEAVSVAGVRVTPTEANAVMGLAKPVAIARLLAVRAGASFSHRTTTLLLECASVR